MCLISCRINQSGSCGGTALWLAARGNQQTALQASVSLCLTLSHCHPSNLCLLRLTWFSMISMAAMQFSPFLALCLCMSVCLSICLSIYLSVRASIYLSVCLSIRPSVRLSIHLSICLSIRLNWLLVGFARRPRRRQHSSQRRQNCGQCSHFCQYAFSSTQLLPNSQMWVIALQDSTPAVRSQKG